MSGFLKASRWTREKQQRFWRYILVYAEIARKIQIKHRTGRWVYMDLTAGPGRIVDGDVLFDGSPLLAMRAFQQVGLEVDCVLIEHDDELATLLEASARELRTAWPADARKRIGISTYCTDNREYLRWEGWSDYALLYWDGLARDPYPAIELRDWLSRHRMHDLLGMASGCVSKRWGSERLDALLATSLNGNGRRRYGYLTTPERHTGWQWIFALITGWPHLAKQLGDAGESLHEFNTPEGRAIIDLIATTEDERGERDRPPLWDAE